MRRSTAEVAERLAEACSGFSVLGPVRAGDLLDLVRLELGHSEFLDGFRPYGGHLSRAIAPRTLLHVVSGNTPHAALQSLTRGLLLQSHNRVKLPSEGLPEVDAFIAALPGFLAERVELATTLPDAWLREADAVIVFGSDETIAQLRMRTRSGCPFMPHGHRVSFGIVFDGADDASIDAAAKDVSLYDQQGCLSPHVIYVAEHAGLSPRTHAARLAEAMAVFNAHTPRRRLSVAESAQIQDLRASYRFRSANDVRAQVWESEGGTDWTVIYEDEPWFATSCLNRVVFVKPLPDDLEAAIEPVRPWLGAIGIWPATVEFAERVACLGASRICALGSMQFPCVTWHAEGGQNLAGVVRWVDFER
jgi:hypothetical protein